MLHDVTPDYSHSKLENPSISDLIDVFENSWKGYIFDPASLLLNHRDYDVAAMTLISSYFEAIWIYKSGENSDGKSKSHFRNGFVDCFDGDVNAAKVVAKEIYKHIRCGLAHTGMLSKLVHYSREGKNAFYVTYPRNTDGSLNLDAPITSIVVNPIRMYEGVLSHFEKYIRALRDPSNTELIRLFEQVIRPLWGVGEGPNIVGMTEDEFKGRA